MKLNHHSAKQWKYFQWNCIRFLRSSSLEIFHRVPSFPRIEGLQVRIPSSSLWNLVQSFMQVSGVHCDAVSYCNTMLIPVARIVRILLLLLKIWISRSVSDRSHRRKGENNENTGWSESWVRSVDMVDIDCLVLLGLMLLCLVSGAKCWLS